MNARTLPAILFALALAHSANADEPMTHVQERFQAELAYCEHVAATNPNRVNLFLLGRATDAAYELGDHQKAASYANQILSQIASSTPKQVRLSGGGEGVYYSHWVLGLLALEQGDVDAARRELLAAGRSPGSPILKVYGPNMRLAFNLLTRVGSDQADRDAVIEFFHECSSFWNPPGLKDWEQQVREGEVPSFRGALYR